jgi:hypothetical protein
MMTSMICLLVAVMAYFNRVAESKSSARTVVVEYAFEMTPKWPVWPGTNQRIQGLCTGYFHKNC